MVHKKAPSYKPNLNLLPCKFTYSPGIFSYQRKLRECPCTCIYCYCTQYLGLQYCTGQISRTHCQSRLPLKYKIFVNNVAANYFTGKGEQLQNMNWKIAQKRLNLCIYLAGIDSRFARNQLCMCMFYFQQHHYK
jgi:hypothetical protein